MFSHNYRSREREVDGGKHQEDLSEYLVPSHFRGICDVGRLDEVIGAFDEIKKNGHSPEETKSGLQIGESH
jgi:pentatricopeptide repeat protein